MALALAAATEVDPAFGRELAVRLQVREAAEAAVEPSRPDEGDGTAAGEPAFLAGYVRYLGTGEPATPGTRDSLTSYLNDPEHPNLGLGLLHSVVNDSEHPQNLGAGHPFNQDARNALARFLGVTGHPEAATAAFEALLCDCVRHLGPEHPVVQGSGVAFFLSDHDVSPVAAAEAFEALLANAVAVLGPASRCA
jgi:hypothetical protein